MKIFKLKRSLRRIESKTKKNHENFTTLSVDARLTTDHNFSSRVFAEVLFSNTRREDEKKIKINSKHISEPTSDSVFIAFCHQVKHQRIEGLKSEAIISLVLRQFIALFHPSIGDANISIGKCNYGSVGSLTWSLFLLANLRLLIY